MTMLHFFLIALTVILLSVGQILFKHASEDLILTPSQILPSLFSMKVAISLAVYAIATLLWLISLKGIPLRVAYPFAASAFFIVPILAHFFLGETLGWNTFVGASLIGLGVIVSIFR